MKLIIIAARNNFLERKFVVELEKKIQAIGFAITDETDEASVAIVINDGRDLPKDEQVKIKRWLPGKMKVTPHKLLVVYNIADISASEALISIGDFVTKDEYSLIGCLKDYLFFSKNHEQRK